MSGSALNVMIVTDCDGEAGRLLDGLRDGGFDPWWRKVRTAGEMRTTLPAAEWDLVLSDFALADFDATAVLDILEEAALDVPFIVLSDENGMDRIATLVRKGARNFVVKDDLGAFVSAVENELQDREARRLNQQSADEIRRQASHDPLTDLPNRRLFFDRLSQGIKRARRQGSYLALLFIDLDRFKSVNDTLGHPAGDRLLEEAAERLRSIIRDSDTAARLGGDEFAIILSDSADPQTGDGVARKILDSMAEPFQIAGAEAFITASIGISVYPFDGADAESLMASADAAMYRVKKLGRNGFSWHDASAAPDDADLVSLMEAPEIPAASGPIAAAEQSPRLSSRFLFWAAVVPVWAVAAILGMLALAPMLAPDDASVIATDEELEMDLDMMPASGPDQ
jgi:diguanylate cyclase (GGDEF)-like protein